MIRGCSYENQEGWRMKEVVGHVLLSTMRSGEVQERAAALLGPETRTFFAIQALVIFLLTLPLFSPPSPLELTRKPIIP